MTLSDIVNNSQFFTDETVAQINSVSVANKALSIINTECKTLFPFMENLTDVYNYMPKNWLFSLLSPYISYAIKMNDSSLSEADRYLEEFYRALNNFKDNLGSLLESYEEGDPESGISGDMVAEVGLGGVYEIDTSNAINTGWFGNNGNGGFW
ncbi:MAG: hypothetical protein IKN65_00110 [Clostridia bacterium]|nr:hypothetical protein [Bacilli bacterium]MBR3672686.1 hypothetical protein [Clostridia bacterium]MBR4671613.1 hypothetical protein [Bacilli bacterium]